MSNLSSLRFRHRWMACTCSSEEQAGRPSDCKVCSCTSRMELSRAAEGSRSKLSTRSVEAELLSNHDMNSAAGGVWMFIWSCSRANKGDGRDNGGNDTAVPLMERNLRECQTSSNWERRWWCRDQLLKRSEVMAGPDLRT